MMWTNEIDWREYQTRDQRPETRNKKSVSLLKDLLFYFCLLSEDVAYWTNYLTSIPLLLIEPPEIFLMLEKRYRKKSQLNFFFRNTQESKRSSLDMLQIISRFYLPESPYQDFQLVGDKSLSEIVAKTKTLSITYNSDLPSYPVGRARWIIWFFFNFLRQLSISSEVL